MEIHIRRNGKSTGPYSLDEVRAALARTEISLDDQAWHPGLSGWTSLESIIQSPEGNEPNVTHAGIEGPIATSAPPARPKRRVGCCGIIILGIGAAAVFSSMLAGWDWIKEGDELHGDTAEVAITIDVPKKLYAQSGVMTLATDDFCISAADAGERVWKAAHRHSTAKKVLLHVYANKPATTNIDRYGNESSTGRGSRLLGDITVINLDEVRRYQDAQHYALHDDAVNTWYRQQLEPMFTNKSPVPSSMIKSPNESANQDLIPGNSQTVTPQQMAPERWLTYGQNVTLHGVLVRQYHTEWLEMLSDSAEAQKRAKTPAYILRLTSPVSARADDSKGGLDDAEQNEHEVYLSSLPDGSERWIDSMLGKHVVVVGKLDHASSVHHQRPVMIDASAVSVDQDGANHAEQEDIADQKAATPSRAAATPPISQERIDGDSDYILYTNRKHGYTVVVPVLLASRLQENASGDTVTATSNDGRIRLLMRVKQDVGTAESQYRQWTAEHTVRDPGKAVDYKTFHGNWFVVSGHDGPRGYYVKVVVRGSESLFLCLEYDEEQSSRLGAMLTRISRSFTGGIDDSSGTVVQATPPPASRPTQTRAVDANAQPVPAAGSLSRREWRERLRKYCTIPSGHQLISNEKRLFAVMGKPDDVEHEGRNTYWYYKCSDGVVQLAFQLDPEMMGGQIIAEVSDR